jgi:hypothetical protein
MFEESSITGKGTHIASGKPCSRLKNADSDGAEDVVLITIHMSDGACGLWHKGVVGQTRIHNTQQGVTANSCYTGTETYRD